MTTDPFSKTNGHVIAARITAENAADAWKPTVGKIEEIDFQVRARGQRRGTSGARRHSRHERRGTSGAA